VENQTQREPQTRKQTKTQDSLFGDAVQTRERNLFLGREVLKYFDGHGWYRGIVEHYSSRSVESRMFG